MLYELMYALLLWTAALTTRPPLDARLPSGHTRPLRPYGLEENQVKVSG